MNHEELRVATWVELLRHRAASEPGRVAFTFLSEGAIRAADPAVAPPGRETPPHLTYAELDRRARAIAVALLPMAGGAEGLATVAGARALLLYPPGLDFIAAFFGCLYAGMVPVPAYPPRRSQKLQRLRSIVADAGAAAVLTVRSSAADIARHFENDPTLARLPMLATDAVPSLEAAWRMPDIDRESIALLQYTSGSTSAPKGVMVTHGNLFHNSESIRRSFGLGPDSVSVTWLPSFHDMGLIDGILQPLHAGFPGFLMAPTAFLQQPINWLQAISDHGATHSGGPNFAYALCVKRTRPEQRERVDLRRWRSAYNGAEPVRDRTLREFTAAFAPSGFHPRFFYPCYGLAEATLMVTGGSMEDEPITCHVSTDALHQHRVLLSASPGERTTSLVGCGRARFGTRVVIADPDTRRACGPERVGEVWVSGPGVAAGYWRQPEQTEETFHAYLADSGEGPFLRTGDLGFLRDGELFLTGRRKDLLILRGRNHYPQDIELTVEGCHPALRAGGGAAFAVTVDDGDQLVVAHEVERTHLRRLDVDEVARVIRRAIAEQHELSTHAVLLLRPGALPKTSSGKTQRAACRAEFLAGTLGEVGRSVLPVMSLGSAPEGAPAREELLAMVEGERKARIVDYLRQAVLAAVNTSGEEWDPSASLLQQGVDSLLATALQHRLANELGVSFSSAELLQDSTIEELAVEIEARLDPARPAAPASPVEARPHADGTAYPLSRGQQALWFLHRMAPASPAYNVSLAVRVVSHLDVPALERAFVSLGERHPALRTAVVAIEGRPLQSVCDPACLDFESVDAERWSAEAVDEYLAESSHRPFVLERGPLFRVRLLRRARSEHLLLLTAHHLVVDFWSLVVLLDELGALYRARIGAAPERLPPVAAQPADHVRWQAELLASERGEALWRYWQARMDGAASTLDLPTDRPRPPVQTFRGGVHVCRWDGAMVAEIARAARALRVTPYMLLLAAYQVLLHRYTGQEDITVGSSVTGRSRPEFAGTIGYFVNQLPLRADLSGNPAFASFLAQVKRTVLEALDHQDYPFVSLVERLQAPRDPSRPPLFQTMLVLEKPHRLRQLAPLVAGVPGASIDLGGMRLESAALEQRAVQFDLAVRFVEGDGTLTAFWEYGRDLFDATTVARMSEHFERLLRSAMDDPMRPVGELPLLGRSERHTILVEWNRTEAAYPADRCLHELFEAQAMRTPNAVAVVSGERRISFRELDRQANQVAHRLRGLGAREESLVGVCLPRSVELVAALLGVLKAGAAYVPLDPSYPPRRLAFMVEDARVSALLTTRPQLARLPGGAPAICVDTDADEIARAPADGIATAATPDHLAYVIYTSGSTGRPKGTMMPHRGLVNYLSWCIRAYDVAAGEGAPINTSIGFDATVTSLFAPLLAGKQVVLLSEAEELAALSDALGSRADFSLVKLTPAHLDVLRRTLPADRARGGARALVVGGEALQAASLELWRAHAPETRIINEYGPTEAAVGCCTYEVPRDAALSGAVPIGRPIANARIHILDRYGQPVPIGVTGELYIGGAGLARGYLRRPELTAERFVRDPVGQEPGERLYRTGDLARYRPDGNIEFLGRIDSQVKIRGFRIELGEIEAVLLEHPDVRQAAVIVSEEEGDRRIAAYVVLSRASAAPAELRRFLAERLPHYMVPWAIAPLDQLPVTPNGKLDRAALPRPASAERARDAAGDRPANDTERALTSIWQKVLRRDDVGRHDNFFDLGGHSLLAAEVQHELQAALGREIPLVDLLRYSTIHSLALHMSGRRDPDVASELRQIQERGRRQRRALESRRQRARGKERP